MRAGGAEESTSAAPTAMSGGGGVTAASRLSAAMQSLHAGSPAAGQAGPGSAGSVTRSSVVTSDPAGRSHHSVHEQHQHLQSADGTASMTAAARSIEFAQR